MKSKKEKKEEYLWIFCLKWLERLYGYNLMYRRGINLNKFYKSLKMQMK